MAETKFLIGKKEELKWLIENLDSNDTSTSTIALFCSVMSEYFSIGWFEDNKKSKGWKKEIRPKLILTSEILKQLNEKWAELENIFPENKFDAQKYADLRTDMKKVFSKASEAVFLATENPNKEVLKSIQKLAVSLSKFSNKLKLEYKLVLLAATIATQLTDGGLTLFHFNNLQHYDN